MISKLKAWITCKVKGHDWFYNQTMESIKPTYYFRHCLNCGFRDVKSTSQVGYEDLLKRCGARK